jgi:UTP--glucose-1-phosphate uridylyltransferase
MTRNLLEMTDTEVATLEAHGCNLAEFTTLAARLAIGTPAPLVEGGLATPPEMAFSELPDPASALAEHEALVEIGKQALVEGRLAVALLNGGMATRFGGGVKSLVLALPAGHTFLELKLLWVWHWQRLLRCQIPVLIMNSEATDRPTREFLQQNRFFGLDPGHVHCFVQGMQPRLRLDGSLYRDSQGRLSLCPPGHGDLLRCLRRPAVADWLSQRDVQVVQVSNVDNLGASPDPLLAGHFFDHRLALMVEVAPQVPSDPGGCPIAVDGKVCVVEKFACPPTFPYAELGWQNTNTLWLRLTDCARRPFPLTWYPSRKTVVDEATGKEATVVQFEQLVGQLSWFLPTDYLRVSQDRFMPMKTPEHLVQWRPALERLYRQVLW